MARFCSQEIAVTIICSSSATNSSSCTQSLGCFWIDMRLFASYCSLHSTGLNLFARRSAKIVYSKCNAAIRFMANG